MTNKINVAAIDAKIGTLYPPPHHQKTKAREKRALGDAAGLTQFGVNLTRLPPGAATALAHWHEQEDEFVWVLEGHAKLVYGDTEEDIGPGDCAGFKAGEPVGHCIRNDSAEDVLLLEIGTRSDGETAHYPGIDLIARMDRPEFYFHLDGTPYNDLKRRGPDDD